MKNLKWFFGGSIPVYMNCLIGAWGGAFIGSCFGKYGALIGCILGFAFMLYAEIKNKKKETNN